MGSTPHASRRESQRSKRSATVRTTPGQEGNDVKNGNDDTNDDVDDDNDDEQEACVAMKVVMFVIVAYAVADEGGAGESRNV